jgi:hypothetical protein
MMTRLESAAWGRGSLESEGPLLYAGRGEDGWLADLIALDADEARAQAQAGTVEDWATESLLAARQAYQDPATGQRIKRGTKLGDACQEANLPVVRRRLYQASSRFAMVLNEAFRGE